MAADDRLLDLLAARATEGLDPTGAAEMERLLATQDDWLDDDLELAAAAAHVREIEAAGLEPMPLDLRRRLVGDAERSAPAPARGRRSTADVVRGLGWYAAAAMLLLAIWAPWSGRGDAQRPTAVEQRAALIAEATDVVTASWSGAESGYAGVSGDVVWSSGRQAGFMTLRGLPANIPAERQYQLWIVDPARDAEPVDGGVFDVPAGATELIVPIDAKLEVTSPTVFAITLEQPGGVVVSEGPLLVVAALS